MSGKNPKRWISGRLLALYFPHLLIFQQVERCGMVWDPQKGVENLVVFYRRCILYSNLPRMGWCGVPCPGSTSGQPSCRSGRPPTCEGPSPSWQCLCSWRPLGKPVGLSSHLPRRCQLGPWSTLWPDRTAKDQQIDAVCWNAAFEKCLVVIFSQS